jgi:hypothetical protein
MLALCLAALLPPFLRLVPSAAGNGAGAPTSGRALLLLSTEYGRAPTEDLDGVCRPSQGVPEAGAGGNAALIAATPSLKEQVG